MELITIASVGVVLASVGYYFREIIVQLFDLPVVKQLVNLTMGLTAREGAELMIQAGKEIVLVLAKVLHLVLHIAGQVVLLIKNAAIILRSFMSAVYLVLSTGNAILHRLIEFPSWAYRWLTTPPSIPAYFTTIFYILMISLAIRILRHFTSPRTGEHAHRSDTKA